MAESNPYIDARPLPGGVGAILNTSGIYTPDVINAVMANDMVMGQVMKFTTEVNSAKVRKGVFADRDKFVSPSTTFEQIQVARLALHDDIVSGVAEGTEALAFTDVSISCDDPEQEDVWNQIVGDFNLDNVLRVGWGQLFSDSQFVAATAWEKQTYRYRGTGPGGRAARKDHVLEVPKAISFFNTLKVTPVGELMWGMEKLAYIADTEEAIAIQAALDAPTRQLTAGLLDRDTRGVPRSLLDSPAAVIRQVIKGRYIPSDAEARELRDDGVHDLTNLFEMQPRSVWRHSLTRPPYLRFARVRMTSIFELLDLKTLLHQMDRAHLIGGANFIVLVTKGSDTLPADAREMRNLRANAQLIGQSPIVVGDHRLKIEIITAKVDVTLDKERYDVIDQRLAARLYQAIMPTQSEADPMKIARLVAASLESRRKMLRRAIELNVIHQTKLRNPDFFTDRAKIVFSPASIQITFDPAWVSALLDLSDGEDISRETLLSQFGLSQSREMALRIREGGGEKRIKDEIADETGKDAPAVLAPDDVLGGVPAPGAPVPGNNGQPAAPRSGATDQVSQRRAARTGGRKKGGNRNGGGSAPGTNQGGTRQNEPENPRKADKKAAAELTAQAAADAAYEAALAVALEDNLVDDVNDGPDDGQEES